jgi:hypothetical protein
MFELCHYLHSLVMDTIRCWCCDEETDEPIQCAKCFENFHPGCVSDECEDGHLCRACVSRCTTCEMPIVKSGFSDHMQFCTRCGVVGCPDALHECEVDVSRSDTLMYFVQQLGVGEYLNHGLKVSNGD